MDSWNLVRPSLVIADPQLMASQDPQPRAASAMNALAHAAEALYGPLANPVAELAALRAAELLTRGVEGEREDELALGSLLAGYAVGSAGFSLHHALGQTLVRITGAPHARVYAVLLPHTLRLVEPHAPEPLRRLGEALGGGPAPDRVAELAARSGATRLSELGVDEAQLAEVAAAAAQRGEMRSAPGTPGERDLLALLAGAY